MLMRNGPHVRKKNRLSRNSFLPQPFQKRSIWALRLTRDGKEGTAEIRVKTKKLSGKCPPNSKWTQGAFGLGGAEDDEAVCLLARGVGVLGDGGDLGLVLVEEAGHVAHLSVYHSAEPTDAVGAVIITWTNKE